jgi:hypothetical protein
MFSPWGLSPGVAMRKKRLKWSPDELARQPAYRKLYLRTKDDIDRLEDIVAYLRSQIAALRERLDYLERDE